MTGYTVHTGSTEKFSSGWDNIFSNRKSAKKSAPRKAAAAKAKKSSGKKKAAKGK
ncbi:MAG: hypothetical protein AB7O26_04000 [Planctomycetaceae bacterium]